MTTFDSFTAYWTSRGWSEQGPVKLASRIDVPSDGDHVDAGRVRVGGLRLAAAHRDPARGGSARRRRLAAGRRSARASIKDSWVQWDATLDVASGDHQLRVRAVNDDGEVQTAVEAEPAPNGASGWHTISFSAG